MLDANRATSCVHSLFEQQARKSPNAAAVVSAGETLSYRELNERANRLTHYLLSRGVGPDMLIGVCLPRCTDLLVSILAILKAGAAYLPLDPAYPADRLAFMLNDADVRLVVLHEHLLARLPRGEYLPVCLDSDSPVAPSGEADNPSCRVTSRNLAYCMYTSGSTGTPKGTLIVHENIVRLAADPSFIALTPEDAVLHASPISFDASTFEIWAPLLTGARIVMFPAETLSIDLLEETIEQYRVTAIWLTASLFNLFVDQGRRKLPGLRHILAGGDALSVRHARDAMARFPEAVFINGYGPTESTTFACCHTIRPSDTQGRSIPIGRTITRTEAYLLDGALEPVPEGASGELCIGGAGLARGYLNRPELTAERFIPNPFSAEAGARLYRTGDTVRLMEDGNLEFLGRIDSQVKVRGFRIELGEVESRLRSHPAVRDAVVVAREDPPGEKRLVAYFIAVGAAPASSDLRAYLRVRLPDYMLPPVFVQVAAFPLTAVGKVDRKALPSPPRERENLETEYAAPVNATQQLLVEMWRELLAVSCVGIEDNFQDLGVDSLIMLQALSRLDELGISLAPEELIACQTIAELADVVGEYNVTGKRELAYR